MEYKCTCGDKTFKSLLYFVNHAVRRHTGEKAFICRVPGCSVSHYSWKNLRRHLLFIHCKDQQRQKFLCQICGTSFSGEWFIKTHQRWHRNTQDKRRRVEKLIIENGGPVYKGDMDKEEVLRFHRKISEMPTSWHKIIEQVSVDGKYRLKCKTCGDDSFQLTESFIAHALSHTGEKTYICRMPECSSCFCDWASLQRHLITHFGPFMKKTKKRLVCEICGVVCNFTEQFNNHIARHKHVKDQQNRPLEEESTSEDDDVVFDMENPSIQDLVEFHEKLRIKPKTMSRFTETIVDGDKLRYKCTACGRENEKQKDHEVHLLMHSGEKCCKCRVIGCSSSFCDFAALEGHLLSHCNDDEKKFMCDICGILFESKENLAKHLPNHNKEKKHKCDHCSADFIDSSSRKIHMRRHKPGNEVLIKCELCDSVFLNSNLKRHHLRRVHGVYLATLKKSDHRRHICDICKKSYKSATGLQCHYKIHTGERNLQCQYCSATFVLKLLKDRHELHHKPGREVLLKCDLCEGEFLGSMLLNSHLRRDHGIAVIIEKQNKQKKRKRGNLEVEDSNSLIEEVTEEL